MKADKAITILREEFPDYEFDIPDTGKFDLSGIIKVTDDRGMTATLDTEIFEALNREGVTEEQARQSLVSFVSQSLE